MPARRPLIAILIAYPAAYAIALAPARWQTMLLFLAMLPFWTNYLIRTYAWIVLLNREGVINRAAMALGLTSEPLPHPLQRLRGGAGPRLQLRAVRHPRHLLGAAAARPGVC